MTVNELLTQLTRIFFFLLFVFTLIDFLRHRDRVRRDAALMAASLSASIIVSNLLIILQIQSVLLSRVGSLAVAAQPYLLLRLVEHFQPVSRPIRVSALIGMIGTWAGVIIFIASPMPPAITFFIIAYFGIIDGYAAIAFIRRAFSSVGVVRQRLRYAAAGSALLAMALLWAWFQTIFPTLKPVISPLVQATAILCAIAYYIGFVPPRWLRQTWQLAELRKYLLYNVQKPSNTPLPEMLDRLRLAVNQAMGAQASAIALWDRDTQGFKFQRTPDAVGFSVEDLQAVDSIQCAWKKQVPLVIRQPADPTHADVRLLQKMNSEMLVVIPLVTRAAASGLLLVFLEHTSLFVQDDINLLTIFAQETAIMLENHAIFEALQHSNEDLERKVQERAAALQASEAELRALFAAMNDVIVVLDSRGKYLKIAPTNPDSQFKPRPELVGKTLFDVFPSDQADLFLRSIHQTLNSHQTANIEYCVPGDAADTWFAVTLSPMLEDAAIWVARDISERKRSEEKMARYAHDLQRSNEDLQRFAYAASHDLQEPLRMVRSYLQLIENRYNDKLDPEGKEFMAFAMDGAARMKDLINGLLTYSRVETQPQNFTMIESQKAFDEACKLMEVAVREAAAIITSDPLPAIKGDERLIIQLFQNLLSNALKYRSNRKPEIHVGATYKKAEWVFSVQDNGIGIDSQYLERIFVIFQRLHDRSKYPGTGIGLAICKKVVDRHGGRIWAESEVGKGTSIYFTIPA